jgi:hypothetical protein
MSDTKRKKPLGRKSYGSIGHLPDSKLGPADHMITPGQARIATEKVRDKHDVVVVQEKLDGSNVGIAKKGGRIYILTRAGYAALTSPYRQHHVFDEWVRSNMKRFDILLEEGERICGEWLYEAHGTRYFLPHEPFVAFDIFDKNNKRICFTDFEARVKGVFVMPYLISYGPAIPWQAALLELGKFGMHGAMDPVEGIVYRVERKGVVDFLCKLVREEKENGRFLESISGYRTINGYTDTLR